VIGDGLYETGMLFFQLLQSGEVRAAFPGRSLSVFISWKAGSRRKITQTRETVGTLATVTVGFNTSRSKAAKEHAEKRVYWYLKKSMGYVE
jgi:hypothetical protein